MQNKLRTTYHFLYWTSLLLLVADTYRSNTTVQKYLYVNAVQISLICAVLFYVLRTRYRLRLSNLTRRINILIIVPFALTVSAILSIIDYHSPLNTVFYNTQIQYTTLYYLGLYTLYIAVLNVANSTLKKHYKQILSVGTAIVLLIASIPWMWPFDAFAYITREDSIVENIQVVTLLLSAYVSLLIRNALRKKGVKFHPFVFLVASITFIIIAGDELTWGQRIFKIPSPEYFLINNSQNETSIHNMNSLDDFVSIGYIIIGIYGSIAWIIQYNIKKLWSLPLTLYIPPWFASNFFFASAVYNIYTRDRLHFIGEWGEVVELLLYLGVFTTLLHSLHTTRSKTKNYKQESS